MFLKRNSTVNYLNMFLLVFLTMKRIILLLALAFFLNGCINQGNLECSSDSDCVPASCCHATECVPAGEAPNCEDIMCTMECKPNTMDCGQGSCKCIDNKCKAILK